MRCQGPFGTVPVTIKVRLLAADQGLNGKLSQHHVYCTVSRRIRLSCRKASGDAAEASTAPVKCLCPACGNACFRPQKLLSHMRRCCRDLLEADYQSPTQHEGGLSNQQVQDLLSQAAVREVELRARALHVAYSMDTETCADGFDKRQASHTLVAAALSLPVNRTKKLLQFASRSIPLPASSTPVQVTHARCRRESHTVL